MLHDNCELLDLQNGDGPVKFVLLDKLNPPLSGAIENFRNWFLIMLFLHREAVPSAVGGNANLYKELIENWTTNEGECQYELKACSAIIAYYQASRMESNIRNVRKAFDIGLPRLVVELGEKTQRGAVLFLLTNEGAVQAQQLVSALSELCKTTMRNTIFNRQRLRTRK